MEGGARKARVATATALSMDREGDSGVGRWILEYPFRSKGEGDEVGA